MNLTTFSSVLESSEIHESFSLEDPKREQYLKSYFYSTIYFKEKQKLQIEMSEAVTTFFQNRYSIQGKEFQRIWQEVGAKIWTSNLPMTAGILRQIDKAFHQRLVYHGPGMNSTAKGNESARQVVQLAMQTLLHGEPASVLDFMETRVLKAVLVSKDANFLNQMRNELQKELNNLAENPPQTKEEEFIWQTFLGNVLSLLPFTYPSDDETIVIPVLGKEGKCEKVEYKIEIITLTPGKDTTPMKALGLTPKDSESANPILIFSGTTFPAGDGHAACVMADFTPGRSVGEKPYLQGKHNIDQWIKEKQNVHVLGVSLGGALSLHAVRHHHEALGRVDAYNPAGLYSWNWEREYNEGCPINIYCQAGDGVSPMGVWPTGSKVSIYRMISHQEGFSEGPLISHVTAYSGHKKVTILSDDPKEINKNLLRKTLTALHFIFSPVVFTTVYSIIKLYTLILAITYLCYRIFNGFNSCIKTSVSKIKQKKTTP